MSDSSTPAPRPIVKLGDYLRTGRPPVDLLQVRADLDEANRIRGDAPARLDVDGLVESLELLAGQAQHSGAIGEQAWGFFTDAGGAALTPWQAFRAGLDLAARVAREAGR